MIRLPNVIVIYPQRKSDPGYLLCWIPAREYDGVVEDPEARGDLAQYHPRGVEVELSPEGLEEYGIDLQTDPDRLREAYRELLVEDMVPASGMVELEALQEALDRGEAAAPGATSFGLSEWMSQLEEEDHLLRRMVTPPPMTEGEEPGQVYRRLFGQGSPSDGEEEGD